MRLSVDDFIALLSGSIAAWLERQTAARIEYLKAENRALRSRLAGRRIIFTDAERRTLATLAKGLGRGTSGPRPHRHAGYSAPLAPRSGSSEMDFPISAPAGTPTNPSRHLIEPAPIRRKRISWSTFRKAHWRGLAASDFFTVEVPSDQ